MSNFPRFLELYHHLGLCLGQQLLSAAKSLQWQGYLIFKRVKLQTGDISGVAIGLAGKRGTPKKAPRWVHNSTVQVLLVMTRLYVSVEHKCPGWTALSSHGVWARPGPEGQKLLPLLHRGHSYVRGAFPCSTWQLSMRGLLICVKAVSPATALAPSVQMSTHLNRQINHRVPSFPTVHSMVFYYDCTHMWDIKLKTTMNT